MSAPWMPLYVADYLADTAHLCASEHGAYLLLIMHYWRVGKLPTDEKQLQRIARMTAREWANSRDTLAALFGDGWTHKRIENELAKSELKSTARAESGSRGGKAKALKNNDASLANATVLPQQKDGFALASSSHSQPEEKKEDTSLRSVSDIGANDCKAPKRENPATAFVGILSDETAKAVVAHRRAKKSPLTMRAAELLAKEFAATGRPEDAANAMIAHGWQGFKAEWLTREARAGPAVAKPALRGSAALFAEMDRIFPDAPDRQAIPPGAVLQLADHRQR